MFQILIFDTINEFEVEVLHLGTEYLVTAVLADNPVCLVERALGTIVGSIFSNISKYSCQ